MVRVIAGRFKNRRLKTLEGTATRPTSDRLKETLFDILQDQIPGAVFLDAFAGCGSVGIEALSRGAASTTFIEQSPQAEKVILENLKSLRELSEKEYFVLRLASDRALKRLGQLSRNFDMVFIDPPYVAWKEYPSFFEQLQENRLLSDTAIIIAEHSRRLALGEHFGSLVRFRQLQQGDSVLSFFHL